jgi:hypothetical protein
MVANRLDKFPRKPDLFLGLTYCGGHRIGVARMVGEMPSFPYQN